jgi:hypothetical protein
VAHSGRPDCHFLVTIRRLHSLARPQFAKLCAPLFSDDPCDRLTGAQHSAAIVLQLQLANHLSSDSRHPDVREQSFKSTPDFNAVLRFGEG